LAHCEYENGHLIFDRIDDCIEVWRLASDFAVDDEGASYSPPDEGQRHASTFAAAMHHRFAPRGHFRPWAKLSFPEPTLAFRFSYPTLLCANNKHAFLHDVRTGALVQTIDLNIEEWLEEDEEEEIGGICYVDVNERHAFVCGLRSLHVFARDGGAEVLRISDDVSMPKVVVVDAVLRNQFVAVLPLCPREDDHRRPDFRAGVLHIPFLSSHRFFYPFTCSARQSDDDSFFFPIAHVSRDGRDLVIATITHRVLFIQDFERICRGETSFLSASHVLGLLPGDECFYMAFEHGRICLATVRVFPFTISRCTHSCPTPFSFRCPSLFFCSFLGFTSSTSKGALPLT
jgi:hypothetical protein